MTLGGLDMISNFNKKNKKDDVIRLLCLVIVIVLVVWFCSPPKDKVAQLSYCGNNIKFLLAKLTTPKEKFNEWIFHRNNAVYLTKMDNKISALTEMDKAIKTFPSSMPDEKLFDLYKERAQIRLYFGKYDGALSDYLRVKNPGLMDKFRIALLYKNKGNYQEALSYCNSILSTDPNAYIGYACLADMYASVEKFDYAIKAYDILIDRTRGRARYFADRAKYKEKTGDIEGATADIASAKELSPNVDLDFNIVEEALHPKKLKLNAK